MQYDYLRGKKYRLLTKYSELMIMMMIAIVQLKI